MVQNVLNQITSPSKEDGFSKLVGHFGRWQLVIFASVFLVKLSSGWVQMAILFLTPKFVFWCTDFDSSASRLGMNSTCYPDCQKYEYDIEPFESTIVSEWNLVCERAWLASFTQTVLQLGILIGSVVFGFMSDRYGRKNTFLFSIVMLIAFGFSVPFAQSYVIFTALRFGLGIATSGTMVVSFVIIMEAIGPKYRELFGCIYQIPFILGHMSVPLFAYYYRRWDTYTMALAVPALMYLGYFFVLNESPRWLISVGRVDDATRIVTRAARMNNLPTSNIKETLTKMSLEICQQSDEAKPNYTALLHPSLRKVTFCSATMWMVAGLTFFGFNQYIGQTSENPFISVVAAGAIQIPANVILIWLIRQFGRKWTTAVGFWLAGLCIVTLGLVPKTFAVTLTLGTLGVSFTAIVCGSIYVYSSELYPTVVRNMGMGASSTAMRIGTMIAPFVSNFSRTVPWLPTVIFGLAPIIAGTIVLMLPETKGRLLPDCMNDIKQDK